MRPQDVLEQAAAAAARDEGVVDACRRLVLAIRRADAERGCDLEKTLRTYYECGSSITSTAEALFLHRNSVRYRLDRVRSLLGFDFDHPQISSALLVAFAVDEAAVAAQEPSREAQRAQ